MASGLDRVVGRKVEHVCVHAHYEDSHEWEQMEAEKETRTLMIKDGK